MSATCSKTVPVRRLLPTAVTLYVSNPISLSSVTHTSIKTCPSLAHGIYTCSGEGVCTARQSQHLHSLLPTLTCPITSRVRLVQRVDPRKRGERLHQPEHRQAQLRCSTSVFCSFSDVADFDPRPQEGIVCRPSYSSGSPYCKAGKCTLGTHSIWLDRSQILIKLLSAACDVGLSIYRTRVDEFLYCA